MQAIQRLIDKLLEALKRNRKLNDYLDYLDLTHETDQDHMLFENIRLLSEYGITDYVNLRQ
ncbi:MAG: hypothetical protein FWE76_07060 [Symbiobacteriaceae bacterium]|nr:hypothetical protein [Symbiobacteriaceae bacterium]